MGPVISKAILPISTTAATVVAAATTTTTTNNNNTCYSLRLHYYCQYCCYSNYCSSTAIDFFIIHILTTLFSMASSYKFYLWAGISYVLLVCAIRVNYRYVQLPEL